MLLVKAPVAAMAPWAVLVPRATVGPLEVSHTTPYWVGLGAPRPVMFPLPVAVVAVIAETACVVTVGDTTGTPDAVAPNAVSVLPPLRAFTWKV